MAGDGGSRKVPSLPPPRPKLPPEYPDLYGKRRELARAHMLEREIGFLEEDLKFVEGLQPASQPCKEVTDFVIANSDPFMPTTTRAHKSCRFWKWLCGSPCLNWSWTCCCSYAPHVELPNCCKCKIWGSGSGSVPKCCWKPKSCGWCCCCSKASRCCKMLPCSLNSCSPECLPHCSSSCRCRGCVPCCPRCPTRVNLCSCCARFSCYHCYICY